MPRSSLQRLRPTLMSWNSEVRLSRISKGPWKKSQVLMVQESICSISCTLQMLKT